MLTKGFLSLVLCVTYVSATDGWGWNPPSQTRYVLVPRSFSAPRNGWEAPPPQRNRNGWEAPPPQRSGNGWEAPPPQRSGNGWEAPPPQRSGNGWEATPPQRSGNGWEAPPQRLVKKSPPPQKGWGWQSPPPQKLIDYPFTVEVRNNGWGQSFSRSSW